MEDARGLLGESWMPSDDDYGEEAEDTDPVKLAGDIITKHKTRLREEVISPEAVRLGLNAVAADSIQIQAKLSLRAINIMLQELGSTSLTARDTLRSSTWWKTFLTEAQYVNFLND